MKAMYFSYEEFHQAKLQEFITYGEQYNAGPHTLLNPNAPDGPKEEPLGIRLKLPPFKGWPSDL